MPEKKKRGPKPKPPRPSFVSHADLDAMAPTTRQAIERKARGNRARLIRLINAHRDWPGSRVVVGGVDGELPADLIEVAAKRLTAEDDGKGGGPKPNRGLSAWVTETDRLLDSGVPTLDQAMRKAARDFDARLDDDRRSWEQRMRAKLTKDGTDDGLTLAQIEARIAAASARKKWPAFINRRDGTRITPQALLKKYRANGGDRH